MWSYVLEALYDQVLAEVEDLIEHVSPPKLPANVRPERVWMVTTSLLGLKVVETPGL